MIKEMTGLTLSNGDVSKLDIKNIDEVSGYIFADCLDIDGNILAKDQWFIYKGANKTVPFTLTKTDINKLVNNTGS